MFNSRVGFLPGKPLDDRCRIATQVSSEMSPLLIHFFFSVCHTTYQGPDIRTVACLIMFVCWPYMLYIWRLLRLYTAAWASELYLAQWSIFRREAAGLWLSSNSASLLVARNFQQFTPGRQRFQHCQVLDFRVFQSMILNREVWQIRKKKKAGGSAKTKVCLLLFTLTLMLDRGAVVLSLILTTFESCFFYRLSSVVFVES